MEAFLETQSIACVGPFLYAEITEVLTVRKFKKKYVYPSVFPSYRQGAIDSKFFVNQNSLIILAQFTLLAKVESSRRSRMAGLPLIMVVPENPGFFRLIGVPPLEGNIGVGFK